MIFLLWLLMAVKQSIGVHRRPSLSWAVFALSAQAVSRVVAAGSTLDPDFSYLCL
jgi:hypothetical protein